MAPRTIDSFDCAEVCKTHPKKYFRIKCKLARDYCFRFTCFSKTHPAMSIVMSDF